MRFRGSSVVLPLAAMLALPPASALAGGTPQAEGRGHGGPRAYHEMCRREPELCRGDRDAGRLPGAGPAAELTPARQAELAAVNARVNVRVRSADDLALHGVSDLWTAALRAGDCEDFMIAKKQALMTLGWAADQLLYAVVEGRETPYHAVLVARTDRGDMVLDNLSTRILPWDRTGYRFVVRQSAADPGRWVRLDDPVRAAAARPGG